MVRKQRECGSERTLTNQVITVAEFRDAAAALRLKCSGHSVKTLPLTLALLTCTSRRIVSSTDHMGLGLFAGKHLHMTDVACHHV